MKSINNAKEFDPFKEYQISKQNVEA